MNNIIFKISYITLTVTFIIDLVYNTMIDWNTLQ